MKLGSKFTSKHESGIVASGRPAAACEVTETSVIAAATPAAGAEPVYAVEPMAAGTVVAGLLEPNLSRPEVVAAAIRSALGQVGPRTKSITLVVPDAAVRVFLLDFDTLPSRDDEAVPVLRFRLRKSVPFDVEQAGISYQVLSEGSSRLETQWKVLAAVIPGPVLAEYEAAVRSAGYEPGAVLPASLASLTALSIANSQEALLAANLSPRSLTTSIVAGKDLLLYRTVELPLDEEARRVEVQRSIAVAAAYFEDTLQVRPHRVVYSGAYSAREFAELLDDAEMAVGEVLAQPETGLTTAVGTHSLVGVTGVLAGTN